MQLSPILQSKHHTLKMETRPTQPEEVNGYAPIKFAIQEFDGKQPILTKSFVNRVNILIIYDVFFLDQ